MDGIRTDGRTCCYCTGRMRKFTKRRRKRRKRKGENKQLTDSWWGSQVRHQGDAEGAGSVCRRKMPESATFDGQFSEGADYLEQACYVSGGRKSFQEVPQMDYAYLDQYASSDQLLDLTPYIENGDINVENCDEGVLNSGKVGDKLYALCIGVNAPALLYNKTLLEDNGIEIKDNMTTDEFIDVCREVYEKTGYKTNISHGISVQYLECWLREEKGSRCLRMANWVEILPSHMKNILRSMKRELQRDGILNPLCTQSERSERRNRIHWFTALVRTHVSWCAFVYSNQLSAYKNAAPDDMEIGITTWPSDDPLKSNYLKPSQFFSISKDTENVEEAIKLLDFWTNSVRVSTKFYWEKEGCRCHPKYLKQFFRNWMKMDSL